ncbi:MAG: N-acetyl sugar amidotransferase [Promethearchaeota archaeon]
MKIQHCKKCLIPNTKPGAIFDEQGICQACHNYEKRKKINWEQRGKELDKLCNDHKRKDGYYDCLIAVSGGKDSHFLVHEMKVKRKMNPLLITVGDPFGKTKAGIDNLKNIGDVFNCDHIIFNMSTDLFKRATRLTFEEFGDPLRFFEAAIYTYPIKIAMDLKIPLIVYGENPSYEYGTTKKENPSGLEFIKNTFKAIDIDFWLKRGFSKKELYCITPPTEKELSSAKPKPIFMGYFLPWSSTENLRVAKKYGFKDIANEWKREGFIEDFEGVDLIGLLVHSWLKYPKFGFQRTSDVVSKRTREGKFSLEEAKKLIKENDHKLDPKATQDFMDLLGYTPKQFWNIIERFWNTDLFEKIDGVWKPKFNYDQ